MAVHQCNLGNKDRSLWANMIFNPNIGVVSVENNFVFMSIVFFFFQENPSPRGNNAISFS